MGDSYRRQIGLAINYAKSHNLELDESLTFHDLGISAYHGLNAETGQLGALLEAVKDCLIPPGSVILVESLDRLSRMSARKALRVIEEILEGGVSVITVGDGREYTLEGLDNDPLSLLLAILTLIRANEESTTKSKRLAAVWAMKRDNALEKPLTSRCPGWLTMSQDRLTFILIPEHAVTVRRIVEETLSGKGAVSIARGLNQEKISIPYGGGRKAKMWLASGISMIVKNPALYGTMIPHQYRVIGGKPVLCELEPIIDYFPSVITKLRFDALRLRETQECNPSRQKHPAFPIVNPLGWLTRCSDCLGPMMLTSPSRVERYLICRTAHLKAGCVFHSVRFDELDHTIFAKLASVIQEYQQRSVNLSKSKVSEIIAILNAAKPDRALLNKRLRSVILSVLIFRSEGHLIINWKDGGVSEIKSAFRPASERNSRFKLDL